MRSILVVNKGVFYKSAIYLHEMNISADNMKKNIDYLTLCV